MNEGTIMTIAVGAFILIVLGMGLAFMGSWLGFGLCITGLIVYIILEVIAEHKK